MIKDVDDSAWVNYYRKDDVSAIALFYLDRPTSGLPPLTPAEPPYDFGEQLNKLGYTGRYYAGRIELADSKTSFEQPSETEEYLSCNTQNDP